MIKKALCSLIATLFVAGFANADFSMDSDVFPAWVTVDHIVPPENAKRASQPFNGTLRFTTSQMHVTPTPKEMEPVLWGDYSHPWALWDGWGYDFDFLAAQDPEGAVPLYDLDATLFPGLEVQFFTTREGDLVPVQRGIIRRPVKDRTASFWELIIGPGKTWKDNKNRPNKWKGWNTAAFPFSLVQSQEGEALIGLAFFHYKGRKVSPLHFQVSNDSAGGFIFWDVDFNMTAWGKAELSYTPHTVKDLKALRTAYEIEADHQFPMYPLSDLGDAVSGMGGDVDQDNVLTMAMLVDGALYYSPVDTPFGEYPYPHGMRVGVWSASKSLIPGIAALRLAEKYGPDFLDARIVDYFQEGVEFNYISEDAKARWEMVTIGHALQMTTGMGPAGYDENWAWYSTNTYQWSYSYDLADQIRYYFNQEPNPYVTGPGQAFYYMDQDMWIAALAMERFLQAKEGPEATLLKMLVEEVYMPIGVDHFACGTSYTDSGAIGFPYSAWGVLPTIDYLAKAGRLIANKGVAEDGTQILNRDLIEDFFNNPDYQLAFWKTEYVNDGGEVFNIPTMSGSGGNYVMSMPNGIVGIALGCNSYNFGWSAYQKLTIVEAANTLIPF